MWQLPFSKRGKTPKQKILALDIGDLFLKFAFCTKEEEKLRVILGDMEELNAIFWHKPLDNLFKIIQKSYTAWKELGGELPLQVLLSFSPLVEKTKIGELSINRPNSHYPITRKEEETILRQAKEKFCDLFSQSFSWQNKFLKEDTVCENIEILKKTINGYELDRLEGFTGKEIKFQILGTFLLQSYRDIVHAISKHYQLGKPRIVNEASLILKFAKTKKKTGIFLDVGGKMTQIVVIKSGEIVFLEEISFGGENFTDILVEKLGMKPNTARELKEQYGRHSLSEKIRERLHELFLPEAEKLGRLISERLESHEILLPPQIWLLGEGVALPEVLDIFKAKVFQKLPFQDIFEVNTLVPQDLFDISDFNQMKNPQYTPLFLMFYAI